MTPEELRNGLGLLEVVTGILLGVDAAAPAPPRGLGDPHRALEQSLVAPLATPPCGVAFSGGRDSSGVLAAAVAAARRHGLPDPVPVTLRFPGVADADESAYQEAVIRHLGVSEWVRLDLVDELDVLGPVSTRLTARHGLLCPNNIHTMVPIMEAFRGGALLTGTGGDEVLAAHPYHGVASLVTVAGRPRRTQVRGLVRRYLRAGQARDRMRALAMARFDWLRPDVRSAFAERAADDAVQDRLFADRHLTEVVYPARYLHRTIADMAAIAGDLSLTVAHPLLDPGFVGAVADLVGRTGFAVRSDLMDSVFAETLPAQVRRRTTKARFDAAFWTEATVETALSLPLEPVARYIDPDALRALWRSDRPKGSTGLLVKYLHHLAADPDPAVAGSLGQTHH